MRTLLQINASMFSNGGQSSQLADRFVSGLARQPPGSERYRPRLWSRGRSASDCGSVRGVSRQTGERTVAQQAVVDYSDSLIGELKRADVLVLGLPMYNFGVPSMLKAYFDHIARAGVTFSYGANGPVGLLTGKEAHVFAARGGVYAGTPLDTQTAYVRDFLRFIGIDNINFVYAEGLNISPERKAAALAEAHETIGRLNARLIPEPLAA
jgi:FMN-dependent NADH-azoreductase